jgi:hypothetical protein
MTAIEERVVIFLRHRVATGVPIKPPGRLEAAARHEGVPDSDVEIFIGRKIEEVFHDLFEQE